MIVVMSCSSLKASALFGKVKSVEGNNLLDAGIVLVHPGYPQKKTYVPVDQSGDYRVELPTPGVYYLKYKGVGVRNSHLALNVKENNEIQLNVYLRPYRINETINGLTARIYSGDEHKYIRRLALKKSGKKTWIGEFETKEAFIHYNLDGVTNVGHPTADSSSTDSKLAYYKGRYVDAYTRVASDNGKARIRYIEPSAHSYKDAYFEVKGLEKEQRIFLQESFDQLNEILDLFEVRNTNLNEYKDLLVDYGLKLQNRIEQASAIERDMLLMRAVSNFPNMQALSQQAIEDVSFDSPAWEVESNSFSNALYQGENNDEMSEVEIANLLVRSDTNLVEDFLAKSKNKKAKIILLKNLLSDLSNEDIHNKFDKYLKKLESLQTKEDYLRFSKSYSKENALAVGNPLPNFTTSSFQAPSIEITNKSLKGRYVLIDFWATWCSPCLKEIPHLKEASRLYDNEQLEIIGVSFDKTLQKLLAFLEQDQGIDWKQVYEIEGFKGTLAKTFEVNGIPKTILVAPDGTIVAAHRQLKGHQLLKTLKRLIES